MASGATSGGHPRSTVVSFETGQKVPLVRAAPGVDPKRVITALKLDDRVNKPVLLVSSGSADLQGEERTRAQTVIGRAMSVAGALTWPTVIDGGVGRGVSVITGAARAEDPSTFPVLLGVSSATTTKYPEATSPGGTPLEPNHTHFVLADSGRRDGEIDLRFALADTLAGPAHVVMLVAGGDDLAKAEILLALKRGWPPLVIGGTGGIADQIAGEWLPRHNPPPSALAAALPKRFSKRLPERLLHKRSPDLAKIADDDLRRIVGEKCVRVLQEGAPGFARQIEWELQDERTLKGVWRTFATYDALAARLRTSFERFQNSILVLGVLATLLALLASATKNVVLHWAAVATPLVVSGVIAMAARRAPGKRWVLLRATAESMKSEIYRYRTRTGVYTDAQPTQGTPVSRPHVLAAHITRLDGALIRTDASGGDLSMYAGPLPPVMYGASEDDDGLSEMEAPAYLRLRLGDQVTYFDDRVKELDRRRERLQALGFGAGIAGAILAAAGVAVWVGLTTAISGAALSYLGYLQVDNTIVTYNQAKARLGQLELDWTAQSTAMPDPDAFAKLVNDVETVLSGELTGWVRQMTQAVEQQQKGHQNDTAGNAGSRAGQRGRPAPVAGTAASGTKEPAPEA